MALKVFESIQKYYQIIQYTKMPKVFYKLPMNFIHYTIFFFYLQFTKMPKYHMLGPLRSVSNYIEALCDLVFEEFNNVIAHPYFT